MANTITVNGKKWKEYKTVETLSEKRKVKEYLKEKSIKFEERSKNVSFPAELKIAPKSYYIFYVPE